MDKRQGEGITPLTSTQTETSTVPNMASSVLQNFSNGQNWTSYFNGASSKLVPNGLFSSRSQKISKDGQVPNGLKNGYSNHLHCQDDGIDDEGSSNPTELINSNTEVDLFVIQNIEIVKDSVFSLCGLCTQPPKNKYCETMRRTVNEMSNKHGIYFSNVAKKLNVTEKNALNSFEQICTEMFSDKTINWGRVVAVTALAGHFAKYCVEQKFDNSLVDELCIQTSDFIDTNMSNWMRDNGGWDGFVEYFPESKSLEDKIWKGLIVTALGLGSLAAFVSVR